MAAKYLNGAAIATQDDWTTTNAGCGRSKTNEKSPNNLNIDFVAEEYNQTVLENIATQTVLGRIRSILGSYGDVDLGSVNETLRFYADRADRAMAMEHFCLSTVPAAPLYDPLNTAYTLAQVAGGCGVAQIVLGAGLVEGWYQAYNNFHQRSGLYRARWMIDTLPTTNGDTIRIGLYRDATHYVQFHSTRAGGAWPVWTCQIDDGGAGANDVLVAVPVAAAWHTFEIETDATGADFWYDRGLVTEEHKRITAAPENGYSHPRLNCTSNTGGEAFLCDMIGARDTRAL